MDDSNYNGLDETQSIILERVKKNLIGLSVKEAKEVLYIALREVEEQTILHYPSSNS